MAIDPYASRSYLHTSPRLPPSTSANVVLGKVPPTQYTRWGYSTKKPLGNKEASRTVFIHGSHLKANISYLLATSLPPQCIDYTHTYIHIHIHTRMWVVYENITLCTAFHCRSYSRTVVLCVTY